ncbi:hypothetical protein IFM89_025345 [Coptis chinensis]|uniref:Uncharacterized protein n=1 Tax=Coptis chinensis TaxID=261450 RepID=A0A835LWI5_9MAGN|nr:hypothetical protein IFM89_025345 [Coptis chinensis]
MRMALLWVLTMPNGIPRLEEFEPNVPQAMARREVENDFPQKFRSAMYALRKEILRKCGSVEEGIAACPDGKDPNHWAAFVRNESTVKNKWRLLIKRKKASGWWCGRVMEVDFDNDELSEVFGPDKGSRTRGISSNKSKKQLQRIGIAKALLQQASSSSNSELKGEMNEVKSSLANVMGVLKRPDDLWAIHSQPVFPRPHKKNNSSWIAIQKVGDVPIWSSI